MNQQRNIWSYLGFCTAFYGVMLVILVVGYPLASTYASPIVSLIFPINASNSLMKSILVMSGMYWVLVAIPLVLMKKQQ
jgi:hypothetical protein